MLSHMAMTHTLKILPPPPVWCLPRPVVPDVGLFLCQSTPGVTCHNPPPPPAIRQPSVLHSLFCFASVMRTVERM